MRVSQDWGTPNHSFPIEKDQFYMVFWVTILGNVYEN